MGGVGRTYSSYAEQQGDVMAEQTVSLLTAQLGTYIYVYLFVYIYACIYMILYICMYILRTYTLCISLYICIYTMHAVFVAHTTIYAALLISLQFLLCSCPVTHPSTYPLYIPYLYTYHKPIYIPYLYTLTTTLSTYPPGVMKQQLSMALDRDYSSRFAPFSSSSSFPSFPSSSFPSSSVPPPPPSYPSSLNVNASNVSSGNAGGRTQKVCKCYYI